MNFFSFVLPPQSGPSQSQATALNALAQLVSSFPSAVSLVSHSSIVSSAPAILSTLMKGKKKEGPPSFSSSSSSSSSTSSFSSVAPPLAHQLSLLRLLHVLFDAHVHLPNTQELILVAKQLPQAMQSDDEKEQGQALDVKEIRDALAKEALLVVDAAQKAVLVQHAPLLHPTQPSPDLISDPAPARHFPMPLIPSDWDTSTWLSSVSNPQPPPGWSKEQWNRSRALWVDWVEIDSKPPTWSDAQWASFRQSFPEIRNAPLQPTPLQLPAPGSLLSRFVATLVLGGAGDALGAHSFMWEGSPLSVILPALTRLGGVSKVCL